MKPMKSKICTALLTLFSFTSVMADTAKPADPAQPNPVINIIEKHFGVTIHNAQEAQNIMTNKLVDCYQKLRQCAPGQYKYAIPDPLALLMVNISNKNPNTPSPLIIGTYTVQGFHGDKCVFNDTYQMQGGTYLKKCEFDRNSLVVFSDTEAKDSAQGALNYDRTNPTPMQKAILSKCQGYINGQSPTASNESPTSLISH